MPEAESFTFFGSISDTNPNAALLTGFPFLLNKVDVSGFDFWTSLGGWSKVDAPIDDAAKAASIQSSLVAGMKLWWNLNAVNCDAVNTSSLGVVNEVTGATVGVFNEVGTATVPSGRVCSSTLSASTTDPNGSNLPHAQLGMNPLKIYRMYEGVTTDEGNFRGYGAGEARPLNPRFTFIGCTGGAGGGFAAVTVGGYLNEEGIGSLVEDYQYVDIDGIKFVCSAVAQNTGTYSGTVDASLLLAEITYTSGATVRNGKAEITSLDSYTYPA